MYNICIPNFLNIDSKIEIYNLIKKRRDIKIPDSFKQIFSIIPDTEIDSDCPKDTIPYKLRFLYNDSSLDIKKLEEIYKSYSKEEIRLLIELIQDPQKTLLVFRIPIPVDINMQHIRQV